MSICKALIDSVEAGRAIDNPQMLKQKDCTIMKNGSKATVSPFPRIETRMSGR
jgi:hypothetical protein